MLDRLRNAGVCTVAEAVEAVYSWGLTGSEWEADVWPAEPEVQPESSSEEDDTLSYFAKLANES